MKKVVFALVFVSLFFVACSKKTEEEHTAVVDSSVATEEEKKSESVEATAEVEDVESVAAVTGNLEEVKASNGGVFAKVNVLENNVNLRYGPGTNFATDRQVNKGDTVYVAGFDDKKSTIGENTGYWVQIVFDVENVEPVYWIFSPFTDLDRSLSVNQVKLEEVNDSKAKISVNRNGKASEYEVNLYTENSVSWIMWNVYDSGFHYGDQVGTFVVSDDNGSKSLSHFACFGGESSMDWPVPSADLKYLLIDSGTAPGLRGLTVYDVEKRGNVFAGSYYGSIEYAYGVVHCARPATSGDEGFSDFIEKEEPPESLVGTGLGYAVYRFYDHNLVTGEDSNFSYQYVAEQ